MNKVLNNQIRGDLKRKFRIMLLLDEIGFKKTFENEENWGVLMRYGDPVTVFDEHCVGDSKELMKKIEILSSEIEKPYCESRFNS